MNNDKKKKKGYIYLQNQNEEPRKNIPDRFRNNQGEGISRTHCIVGIYSTYSPPLVRNRI